MLYKYKKLAMWSFITLLLIFLFLGVLVSKEHYSSALFTKSPRISKRSIISLLPSKRSITNPSLYLLRNSGPAYLCGIKIPHIGTVEAWCNKDMNPPYGIDVNVRVITLFWGLVKQYRLEPQSWLLEDKLKIRLSREILNDDASLTHHSSGTHNGAP